MPLRSTEEIFVSRTKAFATRAAIVAATLLGASFTTVAPASASGNANYTWGDGEPTLCATSSSCTKSGNIVRMWQSLLYVDGLYGSSPDIDGVFGPNTANLTVQWQKKHGISDADGWVGPGTWKKAYDWVTAHHLSNAPEAAYYEFNYPSAQGWMQLRMLYSNGAWEFVCDGDDFQWRTATY
jgi:hypothetical protein